jgi:D-alanine-D-alanine ligase
MSLVAVLEGGRSLERQVSLKSGARVADALRRLGHQVVSIDVGGDFVSRLVAVAPDIAFVALHGQDGEDGTVQELLEVLGVPYTGSRVSACVRASDKVLAKQALRGAGIPTPDFFAFTETSFTALGAGEAMAQVGARLGFPIVVKPASQGSALGIKFAKDLAALPSALLRAFSYDRKVVLERHVPGADLAGGILATPAGEPRALPVVEALPEEEAFYDFESRYEIGRTRFVCPAVLDPDTTARAQQIALDAFAVLGCAGFGRADLMYDRDAGELYVLEVNVIPGLTETSLLPQAADAAGIDFDELIAAVLAAVPAVGV